MPGLLFSALMLETPCGLLFDRKLSVQQPVIRSSHRRPTQQIKGLMTQEFKFSDVAVALCPLLNTLRLMRIRGLERESHFEKQTNPEDEPTLHRRRTVSFFHCDNSCRYRRLELRYQVCGMPM